MHRLLTPLFFSVTFLAAHSAQSQTSDGTIGLYGDASGTISSTTFAIGVPKTLFVLARLEGRTAIGMTGAELRVAGIPDDWTVLGTPNPDANIVLGDPFHDVGGVRR